MSIFTWATFKLCAGMFLMQNGPTFFPMVDGGISSEIKRRQDLCDQYNQAVKMKNEMDAMSQGIIGDVGKLSGDATRELSEWVTNMQDIGSQLNDYQKHFFLSTVIQIIVMIVAATILIYHLFTRKDNRIATIHNLQNQISGIHK